MVMIGALCKAAAMIPLVMRALKIHRWAYGLGALCLVCVPLQGQILYTDVSETAGVDGDVYNSDGGHGLGVNWIDFNADGWPDLFVVGGRPGQASHLFQNDGDGTFSRADDLLPTLPNVEVSGSRFADYDRDGDLDLFLYTDNDDLVITSGNNPPDGPLNILLRNLWVENGGGVAPGEPLFEDVATAAGVDGGLDEPYGPMPGLRSKTASWLDYDRDGCLDLFVGQMVINEGGTVPNTDRLYRNLCDGTFDDVTVASGVNSGTTETMHRAALASGGFHLDNDLWPELYVVNVSYGDQQPYLNDLIYQNLGATAEPATFYELAGTLPGVGDDAQAGMGIDAADIDLDGDWDVYISDILNTLLDELPRGNVLYLNDGAGGFSDNAAVAAGVVGDDSWGVNFFDADNDGWEDLYVSTIAGNDQELLYRNNGRVGDDPVTLTNVAEAAGLVTENSRGSAVADFDRDGDLDLAVVNQNGPLQLFRNDTANAGHWLVLELEGGASSRDAIGTLVEVTTGTVVRRRQVKGGSSAHSQDALAVHIGLGSAANVDEIRIRWASGQETVILGAAADQYLQVVEPLFADGFESGDTSAWHP